MKHTLFSLVVMSALPMASTLASNAAKVSAPATVEATTLHSVSIEEAPGQPGTTVPLRMRDKSGCEWLISATLDPLSQRLMGRIETKQCNSVVQVESGYLVGADDKSGLAIECRDLWLNKAGSDMCLSAVVAEGIRGRLVLLTN